MYRIYLGNKNISYKLKQLFLLPFCCVGLVVLIRIRVRDRDRVRIRFTIMVRVSVSITAGGGGLVWPVWFGLERLRLH